MEFFGEIDYACNNVSDLETQLLQSLQPHSVRSVQSVTKSEAIQYQQHKDLELFLLKERLETMESKCCALEKENKYLKSNDAERLFINQQLLNKVAFLQQQNNDQLSKILSIKKDFRLNIEKHQNDMQALSKIFDNKMYVLQDQMLCLSQNVNECKKKQYQQSAKMICALKKAQIWKCKCVSLRHKLIMKTQTHSMQKQLEITPQTTSVEIYGSRPKCASQRAWNACLQYIHFGSAAIAIFLLSIVVCLFFLWNRGTSAAKKYSSLLYAKVVY